jgi:AcrR family transcriptional regulator
MNDTANIDKKRDKILAAAVSLFRRTHDVRRVSLETIAREARVSPTTIYNKFGTREALIAEVAKTLFREILAMARSFLRSEKSFPEKLTDIIAGKIDIVSQVNNEVIAKLIIHDRSMDGFIKEIYRTEIKPLWLEFIAEGKRQGYIEPGLNSEVFIAYLDIVQEGFRARPELLKNFRENMDFIEQLTRLMFYGFLKKEIDLFKKEC